MGDVGAADKAAI